MINLKNNIISKCLQVLLIGYFLISSINVSNTFNELITQNTDLESTEAIVCNILKKIFNCDGCPEELEEFETKTKSEKTGKGLFIIDYIVPGNAYLTEEHFNTVIKNKNFSTGSIFIISPYNKIHLPPPEFIL